MIDLGTGNNNKINWCIHDKQEMIDIIETVWKNLQASFHRERTSRFAEIVNFTFLALVFFVFPFFFASRYTVVPEKEGV